jgi:hypothetical protein
MKQQKNPTRKLSILTAILILLFGVFIGGYLVLKSGKISAGELSEILKGKSVNLALCEPNENDPSSDADEDGLKDWQEIQLYKTDACKQDSDGDGYLDGEEVASGYDPAKKAPGDELPGTTPKTPRPLPNNLTVALQQKLSEQLSQNKISPLDANGNLLSSAELEQYPGIQQVVWEITQHKDQIFAPEEIAPDTIKITTDNNSQLIKEYFKKVQASLSFEKEESSSKIEAQIFLDAIQNNDFSELERRLQLYQKYYQNLKGLTVPSDFLLLHTQMMDILSSLIKIYQAIINIEADPLKTNLALQQYSASMEQTIRLIQDFEIAVKNHQ